MGRPFRAPTSRTVRRSSFSWSPASATPSQGRVATSSTDCISSGFTSPGRSAGRSPRIVSIDCDSSNVSASQIISSSSIPTVKGVPVKLCSSTSGTMTAPGDEVCRRLAWARMPRMVLDGLEHPIVLAPLAGGASPPELTAAVSSAGGLGFLASGYLTPEALEEQMVAVRELTDAPFGINLFVPGDPAAQTPGLDEYLRRAAPEAARYGAELVNPRYDDDGYSQKLALVAEHRPAVVSFTFGSPEPDRIAMLKEAGVEVWITATTPREAIAAGKAGAEAIVLQGSEAGGHRASFADLDDEPLSTLVLLRLVAQRVRLPLVATGGLTDGPAVAAALVAGAAAAQLGTAFLRADEAGTEPVYREALASQMPTGLTRAFSGRRARGIVNRFMA